MSALTVDPSASVSEEAEALAGADLLPSLAGDFVEVGVETVEGADGGIVFDDNVTAVVAAVGNGIGVRTVRE